MHFAYCADASAADLDAPSARVLHRSASSFQIRGRMGNGKRKAGAIPVGYRSGFERTSPETTSSDNGENSRTR